MSRGKYKLSEHEREELRVDFDIEVEGYYALVPVTREEYRRLFENEEK